MFVQEIIRKIVLTRNPFICFIALSALPYLIPSTVDGLPMVFWAVYWLLFAFSLSWYHAAWLSFSPVVRAHDCPTIFSHSVWKTFLYLIKLYMLSSLIGIVAMIPWVYLVWKPMIALASPQELISFQMAMSGRGELVEPGLSLFYRMMILGLPAMLLWMCVFFRFGYGSLTLLTSNEKVGLFQSWNRSKGTSLRAVKMLTPFLLATGVFMYFSKFTYNSGPVITFIIQFLGALIFTPWYTQALCDYLVEVHFGFLDSGD